jgi:uncharacterized protein
MKQEFNETLTVDAAPAAVWTTVSDIPTVLSWISIVESVEDVATGRYRVVLADKLGPFKLRADIAVDVTERIEGEKIRAHGDGEDRQIGSRLIVDVELDVTAADAGTTVDVRGSYEVTGRPAALGAGSIRKKASNILSEFFAAAQRDVAAAR